MNLTDYVNLCELVAADTIRNGAHTRRGAKTKAKAWADLMDDGIDHLLAQGAVIQHEGQINLIGGWRGYILNLEARTPISVHPELKLYSVWGIKRLEGASEPMEN